MDNYCEIPMILLGYNEKGLIGFMQGGNHLSYVLDYPKEYYSVEHYADVHSLPYISPDTVREVNKKGDIR